MSEASEHVDDSGVHYDIEPRVFELLLDENLNYSSGIHVDGDPDLDRAQLAKMHRIAEICGFREGQRVLDMGCGWSGPAAWFAKEYGVHVTGLNLSPEQRAYGLARAERMGVGDRLDVVVARAQEADFDAESFDHVIFLESIIHMVEKDQIFASCARMLRPGGTVFVQESDYDRQSRKEQYLADRGFDEVDQAFGGTATMCSGGRMLMHMEEAGLVPIHLSDISDDYKITLAQWLKNLDQYSEEMRAIDARAHTMLRRYLMIALGTYRAGGTVCHMMAARKPKT
jgi:cyclopropane-fatty-acyl-phospholipid synthase